ncbi:Repressor of RNA polymerase III transcription MAF1, variant 2 [Balamuthia mandrillaris]
MKFLELANFLHLTECMDGVDAGDSLIYGRFELFTCKRAGSDKKLYKELDKQYEELARSPVLSPELSTSPFGPLSLSTSRRTFISLISTLNASFPDYDFSGVKPEQFKKDELQLVVNNINTVLAIGFPDYQQFASKMWGVMDEEMHLRDCVIYSYIPDPDSDPFCEEGNLWCFNYFFFNKKLRRVLFFTCRAVSKLLLSSHSDVSLGAELDEYDYEEEPYLRICSDEWDYSLAQAMDM